MQGDNAPKIPQILISTDQFDPRERFDIWRDEFALRIARVDVNTPDKSAFSADIGVLPLPNLTVSKTTVAPCSLTRTRNLLHDGDDGLVFILCLDGEADIRFGEDHVHLRPGNGTLVSNHRLGGFYSTAQATTCSIRIDRDVARGFAPSLDSAVLHETRPGDPSIEILRAYLETLFQSSGGLSAPMAQLADNQLRELLAHIVNPASDLVRSGGYGGIKAARLQAVLQEISRNLDNMVLSAAEIGRKIGLSERYVQQLLEGAGFSFSGYVRELRLDRAYKMLRDRRYVALRISDIAMQAGFSDLSYFNRSFRVRYGLTPNEARRS